MTRSGADLALLLLGAFRTLVAEAMVELDAIGHPDFRPTHDFAMRAIASGADNASALGRRLSVTKQAAAKTIAVLQERGYVTGAADPLDGRRTKLQLTERGLTVLREGERIFDGLRARWESEIGADEVRRIEAQLSALVARSPRDYDDIPTWMAGETGEQA